MSPEDEPKLVFDPRLHQSVRACFYAAGRLIAYMDVGAHVNGDGSFTPYRVSEGGKATTLTIMNDHTEGVYAIVTLDDKKPHPKVKIYFDPYKFSF